MAWGSAIKNREEEKRETMQLVLWWLYISQIIVNPSDKG